MINEIRLGTIGTGVIVHSILDGVKRTEGIHLSAVYSRNREKGEALQKEYGAEKVYTDLDQMMSDPAVNFVYVASPNSLHYRQTKMALEHGKNVICEKPFCTDRSQIEELRDIAREKQLYLIDATPTAFLPNFQILKEQIHKIGNLRLVLCNYSQYSSRYDQVLKGNIPNVFNAEFAGGCLQDINYYNVYFNIALFGKPEQAVYFANMCPGKVDSSGIMLMKYPGFVSECAGAKDTWGVNSAQIEGDQGYIYVRNGSNGIEHIEVVTRQGKEEFNVQSDPDRWYYEVQNLTKKVLEGDRKYFTERLAVTENVIDIITKARKEAGIWFAGEHHEGR